MESLKHIFFDEDRHFDSGPTSLIVLIFSVMTTVLICSIVQTNFNYTIPMKLPALIFSIGAGILVYYIPHLSGLRLPPAFAPPRRLLAYYVPAFCLRSIHLFEKPDFPRYLLIYFIMSFVPMLGMVLHALGVLVIFEFQLSLLEGLLFASIFANTEPFFIMTALLGLQKFNPARFLLQGEALFPVIWLLEIQTGIWHLIQGATLNKVVGAAVKKLLGAFVLGVIFSRMITFPLSYLKLDAVVSTGIMVATMVLAYCTSSIVGVQRYLTCAVVAFVVKRDMHLFDQKNAKYIASILEVLYTMTDLAIYSYCVLEITVEVYGDFDISTLYLNFFNYFIIVASRFLSYLLSYPLIKRLIPSFTFKNIMILGFGNVVGCIPLIFNILYLHYEHSFKVSKLILPYMLTNTILTTIINNCGMSGVISYLQATTISAARIATVEHCLKTLVTERENMINAIKTEKYMADVNWQFARRATSYKLPAPYPKSNGSKPVVPNIKMTKICCENCTLMPEIQDNRPKKLVQYKRNAKKLLIQEMKQRAQVHYEKSLISKQCLVVLGKILEKDNPKNFEFTIDCNELKTYLKPNRLLEVLTSYYRKCFKLQVTHVMMKPRARWRRGFYNVFWNLWFRLFIMLTICVSMVLAVKTYTLKSEISRLNFILLDSAFLVIYLSEFVITVVAYSWITWSEGFENYFSSLSHKVDFICLLVSLLSVVEDFIVFYTLHDETEPVLLRYAMGTLRAFIILRVIKVITLMFSNVLKFIQEKGDIRFTFGFELSQEIIECINEVELVADRLVDNKEVREYLMESFVVTRERIYMMLVEIKAKNPWLASTVDTKQVISGSKHVMDEALEHLKTSGLVDTAEHIELTEALKNNAMNIQNMAKIPASMMLPASAQLKFSNIWWLQDDTRSREFLGKRATMEHISAGEIICQQDQYIKGIYIISTGVIKVTYEPSDEIMRNLMQDGRLPIVDNIGTTTFEKPTQFFTVTGQTFGELCFLTGRCSDCQISTVTDVKAYFIRVEDLQRCVGEEIYTFEDLEARLWKYATIKLAAIVLVSVAAYHSQTFCDIKLKLERSFVPNLAEYTHFVVTEEMEDIILLEGVVVDFHARDVYIAPCYIPRSVIKLEIRTRSFFDEENKFQTKLLIIPMLGADMREMMELEERLIGITAENRKFARPSASKKRKHSKRSRLFM